MRTHFFPTRLRIFLFHFYLITYSPSWGRVTYAKYLPTPQSYMSFHVELQDSLLHFVQSTEVCKSHEKIVSKNIWHQVAHEAQYTSTCPSEKISNRIFLLRNLPIVWCLSAGPEKEAFLQLLASSLKKPEDLQFFSWMGLLRKPYDWDKLLICS